LKIADDALSRYERVDETIVDETKSEAVQHAVGQADAVATSLLAYTEARAAFARFRRERLFTSQVYSRIVGAFEEDWNRYVRSKSRMPW